MAQSIEELKSKVDRNKTLQDVIREFYPLAVFLRDCILGPEYSYPESLKDCLVLTDEGEQTRNWLTSLNPGLSDGNVYAVLLAAFAQDGLFIDFGKSDAEVLHQIISEEVRVGNFKYPYVHQRLLMDRHFEIFGKGKLSALDQHQTQELLEGVPQGVFQVGSYVSGPLGLLKSPSHRYVPNKNEGNFAQCERPTCKLMHPIRLSTSDTVPGQAFAFVMDKLLSDRSARNPWEFVCIDRMVLDSDYFKRISSSNLVSLIANGLSHGELSILLEQCLLEKETGLRVRVNELIVWASKTSTSELVSKLNTAEVLQLLLLNSDEVLVRLLDDGVFRKLFDLPVGQIRHPIHSSLSSASFMKSRPELSHLGVRFSNSRDAVLLLSDFLRTCVDRTELEWVLMSVDGNSIEEKLETYIFETDIREIIARFALQNWSTYENVKTYLRYGSFEVPKNEAERELIIDRLMWKFGFDVSSGDDVSSNLKRRLGDLSSVITSGPFDEDSARASAVNVFVALEDFLDESICFAVHSLMGDHYFTAETMRFGYTKEIGRRLMAATLNGGTRSCGSPLELRQDGRNNLFGLIHSFRELGCIVQEQIGQSDFAQNAQRPVSQVPKWSKFELPLRFPFEHRVALFDLDKSAVSDLAVALKSITQVLLAANVDGVRNRIPHGNREFPSAGELDLVHTSCDEVMNIIELHGLSPMAFSISEIVEDSVGRRTHWYQSAAGRKIGVRANSGLVQCGLPSGSSNLLFFHGARIQNSNECLRFIPQSNSPFNDMWRNIPRLDRDVEEVLDGLELDQYELG